jgi:hypothetical protein
MKIESNKYRVCDKLPETINIDHLDIGDLIYEVKEGYLCDVFSTLQCAGIKTLNTPSTALFEINFVGELIQMGIIEEIQENITKS